MSKSVFTRLKTLFTIARVSAHTQLTTPKISESVVEPRRRSILPEFTQDLDAWLFSAEETLTARTKALSNEMDGLAKSLAGLKETVDLISGAQPFPVSATTLRPCAIALPDGDLFDGEILPQPISQTQIADENSPILFEDISGSFERADMDRHAA